jgi:gamma-glutamylcyclotransferase (GGCT)/AIG2-like uncharacterized protein YtfP
MTNGQWLGDHVITGYELYDLGHYPAVIPGEGKVYCEVYRIDSTTLAELDALRTKSGEYKRALINTPYGSAWMYVYQRPVGGLRQLKGGDWLKRAEEL